MPSPQLVTTHSSPMALARSFTVSVLPVPAGPAGAPPRCMDSAWGGGEEGGGGEGGRIEGEIRDCNSLVHSLSMEISLSAVQLQKA